MPPDLEPQALQPLLEGFPRRGVEVELGDDHAAHIEADAPEGVDEAQQVQVVGDAQVPPHLVLLDVPGVDDHDDLRLVLHGEEHPHLAVRLEAGEHPGGVVVVKELAPELQVQLAPELADALPDVGGLGLQVHGVVKADLVFHLYPP